MNGPEGDGEVYRRLRMIFFPRAKKGLGISSRSGSQVAGGSREEDCKEMVARESLAHRLTSSIGRPPARAWASSTRVRPPMLRCMTALNISSPPVGLVGLCLVLFLRVGEPASAARLADEGILDRRRWGDFERERLSLRFRVSDSEEEGPPDIWGRREPLDGKRGG